MLTRTHPLRAPSCALLTGLVLTLALPARAEEPLYVQATSLNLRAEPRPKASVVLQAPIGTQCQVLAEQKGGWVQLTCDGLTGWTQRELLGPRKPDPEQLLVQARDEERPFRERHTAALRALALKPGDEEALRLTRETFFENEYAALEPAAGSKERSEPQPIRWDSCPIETMGLSGCVEQALSGGVEVPWSKVDFSDGRFVAVLLTQEGELQVKSGEFRQQGVDTVLITPRRGYRANPSDALFHALVGRPRTDKDPRFVDPARQEAIRQLLQALPARWVDVRSEQGELRIYSLCGKYVELQLKPGEGSMGGVYYDHIQDGAQMLIRSVEQQGKHLVIFLKGDQSPLRLEYPSEVKTGKGTPLARWSGGTFRESPRLFIPFTQRREVREEVSPCEH